MQVLFDLSCFTKEEINLIKNLNTPSKIQDFLNDLPFNFEKGGFDTIMSPHKVLREKKAHCFEGGLLALFLLNLHGFEAYLAVQKSTREDWDHIVVPFKYKGFWGALSKTNHAVLRFREPIYKNIRELMMSYFHEFFMNKNGKKTFRKYSDLLSIKKLPPKWYCDTEDLWYIDKILDSLKYHDLAPAFVFKNLRKAEKIEIEAGSIVQYKKNGNKKNKNE